MHSIIQIYAFYFISDGNNNDNITNIKAVKTDEKSDNEYISFDVTSVADGNSVLIGDDWSWHLWFVSPKDFSIGSYELELDKLEDEGGYENGQKMMNRNLGASSSIGSGLYYKWGNKNPLIGSNYVGKGGTDGWSGAKSNSDPCPRGYKIPTKSVWANPPGGTHSTSRNSYEYVTNVYYPYSGYFKDGTTFEKTIELAKNLGSDNAYTAIGVSGNTIDYTIKEISYTIKNIPLPAKDIYTNVDAIIDVSYLIGKVWGSDAKLSYQYGNLNVSDLTLEAFQDAVDILSYDKARQEAYSVKNITYEVEWGKKWGIPYIKNVTFDIDFNWKDVEVTDYTMSTTDKTQFLVELYRKGHVINDLQSEVNSISESDKSNALQVRCIKDE